MISIFEMRTMLPEAKVDEEPWAMMPATRPSIYGLMAEFDDPNDARGGGARARTTAGYRRMDAYSPFPIEELNEALGVARTRGCR